MSPIMQLVEQIQAQLYRSCFEADIARLVRQHRHGPVEEAPAIVGRREELSGHFDPAGHQAEVRRGIGRVIAEKRQQALELFPTELPTVPPCISDATQTSREVRVGSKVT
jgi:hypothetical protein